MTKYEALHAKFLAWNTAHNQCEEKATVGMIQFFNGLRLYLGNPDNALHLCKVDPDAEGPHRYSHETAGNALSQTADNAWRFGIEITFGAPGGIEMREVEDNRFSLSLRASSHLFFDVAIEVIEHGFVFTNALDDSSPHASCKFEDNISSMAEFYGYLAGILEQMFDAKPWAGPRKIPVGFESTRNT